MVDVHVEVVIGLLLLACAYCWGVGPVRRRFGSADRFPRAQALAYFGGLTVIGVALNGPLHALADRSLFSSHMIQHLLLMLVAPPLLLAGMPGWLLSPLLSARGVARIGRALVQPIAALAIPNAVLAAWHLPLLFDWAMREHGLHILQHLMLMGGGLLMWWPILSPAPELPRLSPPAQMLYLFIAGLPMALVGALIALADDVLYPFYGAGPQAWGLTPLADQRAGGVIMWVPGTLVFLVALTAVFFRWAGEEARADAHGTQ